MRHAEGIPDKRVPNKGRCAWEKGLIGFLWRVFQPRPCPGRWKIDVKMFSFISSAFFGWIFVPKVSLGILAHRTSEDDGLGWSYITSEVRGPVVRGSMKPFEPLSGGASIPRALGKMLVHFHRFFFWHTNILAKKTQALLMDNQNFASFKILLLFNTWTVFSLCTLTGPDDFWSGAGARPARWGKSWNGPPKFADCTDQCEKTKRQRLSGSFLNSNLGVQTCC